MVVGGEKEQSSVLRKKKKKATPATSSLTGTSRSTTLAHRRRLALYMVRIYSFNSLSDVKVEWVNQQS
jgi:hypothetical protein